MELYINDKIKENRVVDCSTGYVDFLFFRIESKKMDRIHC